MKIYIRLLPIFCFTTMFWSCDPAHTPKPKGYFRIEMPKREYVRWTDPQCPFSFEIPVYAEITSYRDSINEPCWKYVRFPYFNAEVFLSYKPVEGNLAAYIEDTRTLVYKHSVKASSIDETFIRSRNSNAQGIIYDIGGSAASSLQFFVTDSTSHFIRGALYFNAAPQPDSLKPVIEFLREDLMHLAGSTDWNP